MFCIFENNDNNASVVYEVSKLTEEQKNMGMIVSELPQPVEEDGKAPILKVDVANKNIWYEYIDIPVEDLKVEPENPPTLEEQVETLKEQNLILMDVLATIYEQMLLKEMV